MVTDVEIEYSLALIDKAEKKLAQLAGEVASFPPEVANTEVQSLGRRVLTEMEQKLYDLYCQHRILIGQTNSRMGCATPKSWQMKRQAPTP